jgi:Short C-terminal domain
MPLLRRRPLLRAAAVGGGAYALGKRNARAQDEREQTAYGQGWDQSAAAAPAPAAAPRSVGITAEDTERLQELGRLHDQGVLTDEEFAAQKSRILGMA